MSTPQSPGQHAATRTPRGATIRKDYGKPVIGVLVAGTLALTACAGSDDNTESSSATSSSDEASKDKFAKRWKDGTGRDSVLSLSQARGHVKKFCSLASQHDRSVTKAVMSVADDAVDEHKASPSSTDLEIETALEAGVPIYCPKQTDGVKKVLHKGIFPRHREEKQKYIDQKKTAPDNLDFNTATHQVPGLSQDVELNNVEQTSVAGKDLVRIKAWVGNTSDNDPARPSEDLKITASVGDPRQKAEPIKKSELPEDKTKTWHDTIEEFHTLPETESREAVQNFVIPDDVDKDDLWVRVTIRFKPASDKLVFEGPVNEPSIPVSRR